MAFAWSEKKVYEIALLIVKGCSNEEIAAEYNTKARTVEAWRKDKRVIAVVEWLNDVKRDEIAKVIKEDQRKETKGLLERIKVYHDRRMRQAVAMQEVALKALPVLSESLADMPRRLKPLEFAGMLRAVADSIEKGAAAEADALGVQKIMESLQKLDNNQG